MHLLPLAYPLLVHAAVVADARSLEWAALVVLSVNLLYPGLARRSPLAWGALAGCVAASTVFTWLGGSRLFLYAAPVLIAVALCWLFTRTLLPGQEALISRVAGAIRGDLPPRVEAYTRFVTKLWAVFFALFALANLVLAVFAPPVVWSLFANFLNYLFVATLFVGEWFFRRWYLRDEEAMGWREYLHRLVRLDFRRLMAQ